MITETDYNAMEETLHILSSPANVAHLQQSMKEAENGEFAEVKWSDSTETNLKAIKKKEKND